jgi:hypothetical protein
MAALHDARSGYIGPPEERDPSSGLLLWVRPGGNCPRMAASRAVVAAGEQPEGSAAVQFRQLGAALL